MPVATGGGRLKVFTPAGTCDTVATSVGALPEGAGIVEIGLRARADRDRAACVCCCARSDRNVADPAPLRVPAEGGAAAIGEGVLPDRGRIERGRRALADRGRIVRQGMRGLADRRAVGPVRLRALANRGRGCVYGL